MSVTAGLANGIMAIGGTDTSRATTLSFALTPTAAGTGTYTLPEAHQNRSSRSLAASRPSGGRRSYPGRRPSLIRSIP